MRGPSSLFGVVAVSLALVLTLAGCSSERPASGPTGPATVSLTPAADDLIARTGDYYVQQQSLQSAEDTLTDSCIDAAGFTLPASTPSPVSRDEEWRPDPAERSRNGYGLLAEAQDQASGTAAPDPTDEYIRTLPVVRQQEYHAALFGPANTNGTLALGGQSFTFATRGCVAQARTRIYGNDTVATRVYYLPQIYYVQLLTKVHTESAYAIAMTGWSACMRQSGYSYSNPQDAKSQLLSRYRTDSGAAATAATQKLEITIAVADGQCANRVGLGSTTEALLRAAAAALPAADRTALNQVAATRTTSAQRATTLTGR
ncbi:MAG TPA: hypothetical protein VG756_17760 [Pseudonocardiaceae bacterium]|nr:hypothetical protein [Pseudonocardiaceae bacterium]